MSNNKKQYVIQESVALKHTGVSIRPFISGRPNFGLEQYNMAVADGVKHRVGISVMGTGRIKEYVTGVDENTPELKQLLAKGKTDKTAAEQYEAKIKEIRVIVSRAERELFGNYELDPEDPNIVNDKTFWSRVTKLHSRIEDKIDAKGDRELTFWDEIEIDLDNHGLALKETDTRDLLIIRSIEAGGIALVAPSLEIAKDSSRYKFYLHRRTLASGVQVAGKKNRDKAGQELLKLDKDYNKLFYVTKLVSLDSIYYKRGGNVTPGDVLYNDCSVFLDGEGIVKGKDEAAKYFLEIAKLDMDELKYRCMIQDGITNRYLSYKPDGSIYYLATNTPMGKTISECIVFLRDPLSENVYRGLLDQVEKDWTL